MSIELMVALPAWDQSLPYHHILKERSRILHEIFNTIGDLNFAGRFKSYIDSNYIVVIFDDLDSALLFKLSYTDSSSPTL